MTILVLRRNILANLMDPERAHGLIKMRNNGPGAEINRKKAGIAHSGLEAGVVGQNNEDSEEAWRSRWD